MVCKYGGVGDKAGRKVRTKKKKRKKEEWEGNKM